MDANSVKAMGMGGAVAVVALIGWSTGFRLLLALPAATVVIALADACMPRMTVELGWDAYAFRKNAVEKARLAALSLLVIYGLSGCIGDGPALAVYAAGVAAYAAGLLDGAIARFSNADA